MISEKLLKHKIVAKKKQPNFMRQEAHKRLKLSEDTWRKPRGIHSKLRLRRRGKAKMVSVGYRLPEEVRGLTKEGLRIVPVSSVQQLKNLTKDCVVLVAKVSKRQRLSILLEAQKLGINVINFKDIAKEIEAVKKKLSSKKEARKIKEERKRKLEEEEKKKAKMSEKQAKKKDDKKSEIEPKLTEEQKKKIEAAAEKAKEEIAGLTKQVGEQVKKASEPAKEKVVELTKKETHVEKKEEKKTKPAAKKEEKKTEKKKSKEVKE